LSKTTKKLQINIATLDNYLLIIATFLALVVDKLANPELALSVLIVGAVIKAVGSALIEGESLGQNLDNIALAVVSALAPVFPAYGFYLISAATLLKAIGSNGLRNIIPAAESIISSLPTASTASTASTT
jgi:cytosine/uracil/thiamine/allantoin permease